MDWGDGEAAATKAEEEEEEQGGASAPAGAGRAFGSIADDDGSRRESWLGPDGDTDLAGGASAAYFVDDIDDSWDGSSESLEEGERDAVSWTGGGAAAASSGGELGSFAAEGEYAGPPPLPVVKRQRSDPLDRQRAGGGVPVPTFTRQQPDVPTRSAGASRRPAIRPPTIAGGGGSGDGSSGGSASLARGLSDSPWVGSYEPLTFELAFGIMSQSRALMSGQAGAADAMQRPDHLCISVASPTDVPGRVFAEVLDGSKRSKRRPKTDLWQVKGGVRNVSDARVSALGPDQLLRRSYGIVSVRPERDAVEAPEWEGKKFKFHEYHVVTRKHKSDCPERDQKGAQCECPFTTLSGAPAEGATQFQLWHVLGNVNTQPQLPPGQLERHTGRLDTAPSAHTVRGPLQLQQQQADDSFIVFKGVDGGEQGQLHRGERGLTLVTTAGDFAEWHPRAPLQKPFEEGDVVSITPEGLSRDTQNASQVGVISRWAAVEASAPAREDRDRFDRVAYTGHVPVKLRGICKAGDIIVPSGDNDCCAKAMAVDDPAGTKTDSLLFSSTVLILKLHHFTKTGSGQT